MYTMSFLMQLFTFACSNEINGTPRHAHNAKNAIGAQHIKSVKTSKAIRFAIRESLEFHAYKFIILIINIAFLKS